MKKKYYRWLAGIVLVTMAAAQSGCGSRGLNRQDTAEEMEKAAMDSGEVVDGGEAVETTDSGEVVDGGETLDGGERVDDGENVDGGERVDNGENADSGETLAGEASAYEPETVQITINAVGDITLGTNQKHTYWGSFHQYYDEQGADYFLQNVREIFETDDFTIGNLEGTLTESDQRNPKLWNHKGKPEYVNILTGASIEAVSLGNNHIMDYGQEGVDDTIKYVSEAGLEYALSGEWGNRYGLYETEKGITIGFVSVNEHYDEAECYQMLGDGLKELKQKGADLLIACTHWGDDKVYDPAPEQYLMGKWCIDMGYDVVLGCHPHLLQGVEYYKGKYIVHSMGNFCYGGNKNPEDKETMIWQQTFTFADGVLQEDSDVTIIPCRLSSVTNTNDYCPVVLEGEEAGKVLQHINERSVQFGVKFDENGKHIKEETAETMEETETMETTENTEITENIETTENTENA